MALQVFRFAFAALGLAAILIGVMMFLMGPAATGHVFASMLDAVAATGTDLPGLSEANTDSELRFYSVFWLVYGLVVLRVSGRLPEALPQARMLLALFSIGGIGRVLSVATAGIPHPLFLVLMWVELVLPAVLLGVSFLGGAAAGREENGI
ncbi:MAG: DUF4345 domain-containing protein [Hyphomonas sp.]|uniref:DUF4345 domain-containing protein n=1 Tax=Hyphomonas sp. TaxID=87 RepID=UPI0035289E39